MRWTYLITRKAASLPAVNPPQGAWTWWHRHWKHRVIIGVIADSCLTRSSWSHCGPARYLWPPPSERFAQGNWGTRAATYLMSSHKSKALLHNHFLTQTRMTQLVLADCTKISGKWSSAGWCHSSRIMSCVFPFLLHCILARRGGINYTLGPFLVILP